MRRISNRVTHAQYFTTRLFLRSTANRIFMTSVARTTFPRERILQAAADLFAEAGFRGASTRDIARTALVNDATVYRHFSSKKDLFAAVLEADLQKLRVRADLLVQVANAEDLRSALCLIFALLTTSLAE